MPDKVYTTYAKVGIYADQRIGEILRELPKAKNQYDARSSDMQEEHTKADAIKDAGISRSQAYDLQKLAANPDVVQAVLDKAEADGRIPSRNHHIEHTSLSRSGAERISVQPIKPSQVARISVPRQVPQMASGGWIDIYLTFQKPRFDIFQRHRESRSDEKQRLTCFFVLVGDEGVEPPTLSL